MMYFLQFLHCYGDQWAYSHIPTMGRYHAKYSHLNTKQIQFNYKDQQYDKVGLTQ